MRGILARLCERHGFVEAAEVLKAACDGGVMTLSPCLSETRDGREEAISALQEAYEEERKPVIVIAKSGPDQ